MRELPEPFDEKRSEFFGGPAGSHIDFHSAREFNEGAKTLVARNRQAASQVNEGYHEVEIFDVVAEEKDPDSCDTVRGAKRSFACCVRCGAALHANAMVIQMPH